MFENNISLVNTVTISVNLHHHITYIYDKSFKRIQHTLLFTAVPTVAVLPFILFVSVHVGIITGQTRIIRAVHILPGTLVASSAVGYCTTKRITII